jgi:hypothetical protein
MSLLTNVGLHKTCATVSQAGLSFQGLLQVTFGLKKGSISSMSNISLSICLSLSLSFTAYLFQKTNLAF